MVAIENFTMPERCDQCRFVRLIPMQGKSNRTTWVAECVMFKKDFFKLTVGRREDCPLKEI